MDKSFKYKIFNDPIHGFLQIPKGNVLRLIDHPYVQRLRRIRQLGLGYLVFPGAEHSRFSHAVGALGLMQRVLKNLQEKDTTITYREFEGTLIAILLHDIGHGPFSHTLEFDLIEDFHHEMMTLALMHRLNKEFPGVLDIAIQIFTDQHPKKFLHQLISSQLDLDRLDYLKRDSFFTGVSEGAIGIERILKTMRVHQNNIVIEQKGIYAVENYIIARRLMYMQVYLHKTVLSADKLLRSIFKRVKFLRDSGENVYCASPALSYFLEEKPSAKKVISNELMDHYMLIDDSDVLLSIKYWQRHSDLILSDLSRRFLNRDLFRTTFFEKKPSEKITGKFEEATRSFLKTNGLPHDDHSLSYYLFTDFSYSEAYKYQNESIWILNSEQTAVEFSKAADTRNIIALTKPVVKHYIAHLKEL